MEGKSGRGTSRAVNETPIRKFHAARFSDELSFRMQSRRIRPYIVVASLPINKTSNILQRIACVNCDRKSRSPTVHAKRSQVETTCPAIISSCTATQ